MRGSRIIVILAASVALTGCGASETATTAAVVATGKAREVEQAQATKERVEQQVLQAEQQAAERLKAAEQATQ